MTAALSTFTRPNLARAMLGMFLGGVFGFGLVVILSGLIALGPLFLDSPRKPPEPDEEEGDDGQHGQQ